MQAIEQFRARYPQGGLLSEFLTIESGHYLVRVTVEVDGTPLATGLAAAETLEAAEDRARERALVAVGIGSATAAPNYSSAFPDFDLPAVPATNEAIAPPPEPASLSWDEPTPPSEPSDPAPAIAPKAASKKKSSVAKTPKKSAVPAPEPTPAPAAPSLPSLGATEVVTRAKAELKRLGWTREQGQKFLLERYGKRETRQLDDREWRDLYEYLYEQPNPAR